MLHLTVHMVHMVALNSGAICASFIYFLFYEYVSLKLYMSGARNQITKNLACEWAMDHIRVSFVAPWLINTSLVDKVSAFCHMLKILCIYIMQLPTQVLRRVVVCFNHNVCTRALIVGLIMSCIFFKVHVLPYFFPFYNSQLEN